MHSPIVRTLLELGHATSHNLAFSHRPYVLVSYGEETITETNLLEIRRRHPNRTYLQMFSKHQEANNGADWEWHIVGRRRTLKMRIQAKRLQRNHVLRVKHRVGSTGVQQRDLLINAALADGMKPVYCLYCTERQRSTWTERLSPPELKIYQMGCLLADAANVPLTTRHLTEIENKCIPWHFLFNRTLYAPIERAYTKSIENDQIHFSSTAHEIRSIPPDFSDATATFDARWNPPTVRDLNDEIVGAFDQSGVRETTDEDRARVETDTPDAEEIRFADRERLLERRIPRMLVMDVRDE